MYPIALITSCFLTFYHLFFNLAASAFKFIRPNVRKWDLPENLTWNITVLNAS